MEYQKNGKKLKNGVRHDEQLLINYSGGEQFQSESDSDRVKPLELPPTRLRRPKSRKIRVSSSNTKSVFSLWNFCQVLFVIVTIGTMVCMVWFTVILKTSLDNMRKRVSILETSDRSTSKECAARGEEIKKNLEALRGTTASLITNDDKKIKMLLQKISILNRTVDSIYKRLKSPKSASSIHNDISLLKKAMADTGREMTEITDKVTQLRRIAHLQNNNIKHLKVQMYNVTVQLAKLSGKPTPRPVINTGTPPWLLRVPADSNSPPKPSSVEVEKIRRNITLHVKKDMIKIAAYIKKANTSVQNQVHNLQKRVNVLLKNFEKQKVLIQKLSKQAKQGDVNHTMAVEKEERSVEKDLSNVSSVIDSLTRQLDSQTLRYDQLELDVSSINHTVHNLMKKNFARKNTSCKCDLQDVRSALARDQDLVRSFKTELDDIHKSIEKLQRIGSTTTLSTTPTTAKIQSTYSETDNRKDAETTERPNTVATSTTKTEINVFRKNSTDGSPETTIITPKNETVEIKSTPNTEKNSNKTDKPKTDDDDDLDLWPGDMNNDKT